MRFVYPSANERHWQIDQEPSSLLEPCVRDYPVEHSAAVARNLGLVNDHGVADMPAHNASYDDPDCVFEHYNPSQFFEHYNRRTQLCQAFPVP